MRCSERASQSLRLLPPPPCRLISLQIIETEHSTKRTMNKKPTVKKQKANTIQVRDLKPKKDPKGGIEGESAQATHKGSIEVRSRT